MFAGIRETAEECNLYLAKKKKYQKKNIIINNSWDRFLEKSLVPSFSNLKYFARAITNILKIRFHARFFF